METQTGADDVLKKLDQTEINGQKVTIEKIISDPTLKSGQNEVTTRDPKATSGDPNSKSEKSEKEEQKTSRKRSREKSADTTRSDRSRQVTKKNSFWCLEFLKFLTLKNSIFSEFRIFPKT